MPARSTLGGRSAVAWSNRRGRILPSAHPHSPGSPHVESGAEHGPLEELTVREFEILRMLVEAQSTEKIAQALHISPKTVSNCHYQIKKKLGVATDIELVRLALRLNVVDLLELSKPEADAL